MGHSDDSDSGEFGYGGYGGCGGGYRGYNNCGVGYGWGWGWGWGWWCPCLGAIFFFLGFAVLVVAACSNTAATATKVAPPPVVEPPPQVSSWKFWKDSPDSLPSNWMTTMQNSLDNNALSTTSNTGNSFNMVWINPQTTQGQNAIMISRTGSHYFGVGIPRVNGKYAPVHWMEEFVKPQGQATVTQVRTGAQWDLYAFYATPKLFQVCRTTVITFQTVNRQHGHGGGGGNHGGNWNGGGHHGGGNWNGGGNHHGDWHGDGHWNGNGHGHGGWGWGNGGWGWGGGWFGASPIYVTQPVDVVVANPQISYGDGTVTLSVTPINC